MSIVEIQCPKCGAAVERKENSYFAKCRYCGCEICFDEAKAESEVAGLRGRVNDLDSRLSREQQYKQQMKKWEKKRNIMYTVTGAMSFVGFLFAILSDGDDGFIAAGVMLIIFALMGLLIASLMICARVPVPTDGKPSRVSKLFRTLITGFFLLCGTAFLSAMIYAIADS